MYANNEYNAIFIIIILRRDFFVGLEEHFVSQYEKYYCFEIIDHIGVIQTCDSERVDCLKNS